MLACARRHDDSISVARSRIRRQAPPWQRQIVRRNRNEIYPKPAVRFRSESVQSSSIPASRGRMTNRVGNPISTTASPLRERVFPTETLCGQTAGRRAAVRRADQRPAPNPLAELHAKRALPTWTLAGGHLSNSRYSETDVPGLGRNPHRKPANALGNRSLLGGFAFPELSSRLPEN